MSSDQLFLKMVFDRWNGALKNWNDALNALSDEQLQKEIAPGKNRGVYLLGHMVAVHDDMLILLDMGNKLYPELTETFIKSPDKAVAEIPPAKDLREKWNKHCEVLNQKFGAMQPSQWFEKHTAVPAEEFVKEPHRNKLNIIITRTTHMTYHTGQLVLLK
jgi:uncharacterized damage-inducible protein DinB